MDKINDTIIKIVSMDEISKPQRLIAKTGDTKGRDLYVQLVDDKDKGIDTTEARLTLAYRTPSGIVNEIAFTPVNAEEGLYGLTYDDGLTHEAGVVTATIRLKTYGTTTETPNFEIYVEGSPLEGIHFTEVEGLTFKKVMDKVDSIDFRANLIEEDILHIDQQLQDMNTRIVYVEEEDGLEERVYNTENDIQLLEQEVERLDTELADLRLEVDNIEVVEGGGGGGSGDDGGTGGGTGEQDTGWRVLVDAVTNSDESKVYIRRLGAVVEYQGRVKNLNEGTSIKGSFTIKGRSISDMFLMSKGLPYNTVRIRTTDMTQYDEGYKIHDEGSVITVISNEELSNGSMRYYMARGTNGYFNMKYLTDRPFTDEYMDLPLADFT